MTKEEQVQLNALAIKLERYASRTEEALNQTSARLDRLDKTLNTNSTLLREGWQQQQTVVAGLLGTCAERQQRLLALEDAVRTLEQEDRTASSFDPHIVTPIQGVPFPLSPVLSLPTLSTAAPPRKTTAEVKAARADQAWRWIRERASTILAMIALITALGAGAVWMVSTYQQMEWLRTAVIHAADSGAPPAR